MGGFGIDPLDVRFPAHRRVRDTRTGAEGTVIGAWPTNLLIGWDNGSQGSYNAAWFADHPAALRLIPNIGAARVRV